MPMNAHDHLPQKNTDILSQLQTEAQYWDREFDFTQSDLTPEKMAQVPLLPLWQAVHKNDAFSLASALPLMTTEQRQALLDLDQWKKDQLAMDHFEFWPKAYAHCPDDEVVMEFVTSDSFLLLLKGRFQIYTFDAEDPQYPEHDNYFLTDDSLLLVEYDQDFEAIDEVRNLIRKLYAEWGVEKAYAHLFKMVAENYLTFEEECYQNKKQRLNDFGIVDYYQSLEVEYVFNSETQLHQFILRAIQYLTPDPSLEGTHQCVSSGQIKAFEKNNQRLQSELAKISSPSRNQFLRFNFVRLLNSRLAFSQEDIGHKFDLFNLGRDTQSLMLLGFEYCQEFLSGKVIFEEGLFQKINFHDLYRVGNSLIKMEQKKIKNMLIKNGFVNDQMESFLGQEVNHFLDALMGRPVRLKLYFHEEVDEIRSLTQFQNMREQANFLEKLLAFAQKIWQHFQSLIDEGKISNDYFLNYKLSDIDLESILSSGLAHFVMATEEQELQGLPLFSVRPKTILALGQTYFSEQFETQELMEKREILLTKITRFVESYGLSSIAQMESFLYSILERELKGNQWEQMSEKDLAHVGGPIILAL